MDLLFEKGNGFVIHPFKVVWIVQEDEHEPVLIGISVGKRLHKRANKRNLLKRRIREAYRKNNASLKAHLTNKGVSIAVMILYISEDIQSYGEIQDKIILLLQRLEKLNA